MNYTITENKLNIVIDSYISKQFGDLEHNMDGDRLVLSNIEGQPVIIILFYSGTPKRRWRGGTKVFILDQVYASVYHLFSMISFDEIQHHLIKWFKKHFNISVDEVQTFDAEEYEYIY